MGTGKGIETCSLINLWKHQISRGHPLQSPDEGDIARTLGSTISTSVPSLRSLVAFGFDLVYMSKQVNG